MTIVRHTSRVPQLITNILSSRRCDHILSTLLVGFCFALVGLSGCGQTSPPPVTTPTADQVNSYFSGPFAVSGSDLGKSSSTFDHSTKQIGVSALSSTQVPTEIMY